MKSPILLVAVIATFALSSADAAAQNVSLEMKSVVPDSLMLDEYLLLPMDLSPLETGMGYDKFFPARSMGFDATHAGTTMSNNSFSRLSLPKSLTERPLLSISPHQFALPDNPRWVGRWGMSGSVNPYPGMGSSNSVSVGRGWAVNDRITIYGGAYATDNLFYTSHFKNFGVSSRVRVQVAERVFVTGFGNYSIYNGADGQPLPPLMYPGHSFGGSVEVKITDKFGLQAVAERSYNAFTRRWDNSYYVLPVFY